MRDRCHFSLAPRSQSATLQAPVDVSFEGTMRRRQFIASRVIAKGFWLDQL